jgi:hypothetical protein
MCFGPKIRTVGTVADCCDGDVFRIPRVCAPRSSRASLKPGVRTSKRCIAAAVARRRLVENAKPVRSAAVNAVTDAPAQVVEEVEHVDLDTPLESHPDLVRGKLENGFEYVILPNKSPPGRFEAHLQVRR